ncbi:hypothetical protein D3C75_1223310 [compost metagenome]
MSGSGFNHQRSCCPAKTGQDRIFHVEVLSEIITAEFVFSAIPPSVEVVDLGVAANGIRHSLASASIGFALADLGHQVNAVILDQHHFAAIDTGLG